MQMQICIILESLWVDNVSKIWYFGGKQVRLWQHGGSVYSTDASQWEGPWFESWLCEIESVCVLW